MKNASHKTHGTVRKLTAQMEEDYDEDSYQELHEQKLNDKKTQQNRDKSRKLKRS